MKDNFSKSIVKKQVKIKMSYWIIKQIWIMIEEKSIVWQILAVYFPFRLNRTHHNIFPDDFMLDQLTILPENIEKIKWVLQRISISSWKKTFRVHEVNLFFLREDRRGLLYYVCITFKFSNINLSVLILQLQKCSQLLKL